MKQPKPKPTPPDPPVEYFNPNPSKSAGYCWLSGAPLGQFGPGKAGITKVNKVS